MSELIYDINELDFNKLYSYADYLRWRFEERVELIRGQIFRMSPAPTKYHQQISFALSGIFYNSVYQKGCEVFAAPFDLRLGKTNESNEFITTVVQPDFCIFCGENKTDYQGGIAAPDLIVEILSPGTSKKDKTLKFDLYEENGVREYWIIDPSDKSVLIYVAENGKFIGKKPVTEGDILSSFIFPELKFELALIF
ncbi:MAG: Uma2 family endonuclease [Flavobacteriaceae bacterium]|nr:Uma2 family endonuclease [Flavobacteriaceae bacterium]